jgi:hypothetical protein
VYVHGTLDARWLSLVLVKLAHVLIAALAVFEETQSNKVMRSSAPPSPPEASASSVPSMEAGSPPNPPLPPLTPLMPTTVGSDQSPSTPVGRGQDSPGYLLRRRTSSVRSMSEDGLEEHCSARRVLDPDGAAVEYQQTAEALLLLSDTP